jgi:uncharacterized OsmC-like protein
MADARALKQAIERNTKAVTLRPSFARGTSSTYATIVRGCTCEITEGPWRLVADIPKSEGGDDNGPTPGVLGRGALGSCLAMTIVAQAAAHDVPVDAVSIEVQADWDGRGYLGVGDNIPAGYTQVRVIVDVKSSAPEHRVREIVKIAERLSPWVDVFRRENDVAIDARIAPPDGR